MTLVRWQRPRKEDVIVVVNVATGGKFLMNRADHARVGTDQCVAVVEDVGGGKYLERVFVGRYLEFAERLVIPRRTASWDARLCPSPEDGECWCDAPHVEDHSTRVDSYEVGGIASRIGEHGFARYRVTRIDDRGVWGTYIEE